MTGATAGTSRRTFLAHFSGLGLGSTLLPGVLWGRMQDAGVQDVTREMLSDALAVAGLDFTDEQEEEMLEGVNRSIAQYVELRKITIPNDVSPPFHFNPLVPGMTVNRTAEPFRMSSPDVSRPARLEDVAFWPVTDLGELIRTRQVTSVELTEMYLDRLRRHNTRLNCVVTMLEDLGMQQARQADRELAAGQYRGPLHGIPWGAKDIIAVKGHPTTWGSDAYKEQVFDYDSSVVEMLRDAGAVLVAKLTTGELASGDRWFGGQTLNPWNLEEGSSGSSAGPSSATAAGLVGFAIGTETSGSILSPAARCGVTGLRPTLGRVTRHGAMVLSWTQDRMGPMCRSVEDCALVMRAISKPDGRDMSIHDLPFNWDSERSLQGIRVGVIQEAFDAVRDPVLRQFDADALAVMERLGVRMVDVPIPTFTTDLSAIGVESAAFFDELIRTGGDQRLTNPGRAGGWRRSRVVPAVEFLQHQRIRMMMMMELAEATAHVDVWLVPRSAGGGGGGGGGAGAAGAGAPGAAGGAAAAPAGPPPAPTPPGAMQRHSSMANLATYPALSVPHGFMESGSPAALNFYARPFGETELLTVAHAWQRATDFHRRTPNLTG